VIGHELLRSAAEIEGGAWSIVEMDIRSPLKVTEGGARTIRLEVEGDALKLTSMVHNAAGTVLEPDRVYMTARREKANEAEVRVALAEILERTRIPVREPAVRYPYVEMPAPLSVSRPAGASVPRASAVSAGEALPARRAGPVSPVEPLGASSARSVQ